MRRCIQILILAGLVVCGAAVADSISGVITNPKGCTGVQALLRKGAGVKYPCKPKVFPASFDRKTGKFAAKGLPTGRYDLRLLLPGGRVETVDMRLETPDEEGDAFGEEDKKAILEFIANYPQAFADTFRPIFIKGNTQYAKVLVEKIRARQFHSGKAGEITWRVEVWNFQKHTEAWVKTQRKAETVARLRVFVEAKGHYRKNNVLHALRPGFVKMTWLFSPAGGLEVDEGEPVKGLRITVPERDGKHGKVAGSVDKQIDAYRKKEPPPFLLK